jgi:hypothetical protein
MVAAVLPEGGYRWKIGNDPRSSWRMTRLVAVV